MSKNYKVTGHIAIIGVGIVLKLYNSQAKTRTLSLKQKRKNIYIVLEPVQFKQGEEITIISGNISKSVLKNLSGLSEDTKKPEPKDDYTVNKNQKSMMNIDKERNDEENNKTSKNHNDKYLSIISGSDVNNLPSN